MECQDDQCNAYCQQFNEDEEKHEQQQCLVFNQRRRGRHPQENDLLKQRLRVIVQTFPALVVRQMCEKLQELYQINVRKDKISKLLKEMVFTRKHTHRIPIEINSDITIEQSAYMQDGLAIYTMIIQNLFS